SRRADVTVPTSCRLLPGSGGAARTLRAVTPATPFGGAQQLSTLRRDRPDMLQTFSVTGPAPPPTTRVEGGATNRTAGCGGVTSLKTPPTPTRRAVPCRGAHRQGLQGGIPPWSLHAPGCPSSSDPVPADD